MQATQPAALMACSIAMRFVGGVTEQAVVLLRSVVGLTEAKAGCLACTVARDATDEHVIRYAETWEAEAAFRRHVTSEEFRRVLLAMDMCCEKPQVIVGNLAGHSGLDALLSMCGKVEGSVE